MNKLFLASSLMAFSLCCCTYEDRRTGFIGHPAEATAIFINETADSIVAYGKCQRDMPPGDTLKLEFNGEILGKHKPNVDNFPATIFSICTMQYKEGDILKCDDKMKHIGNYENRKEIRPRVFEFTFRFTEERKANATPCN